MKKYFHPALLRLVDNVLDRIPQTSRGTYNRQDPTFYAKGSLQVGDVELKYHDVTWGTALMFIVNGKEVADFYRDHDKNGGLHVHGGKLTKEFIRIMFNVVRTEKVRTNHYESVDSYYLWRSIVRHYGSEDKVPLSISEQYAPLEDCPIYY